MELNETLRYLEKDVNATERRAFKQDSVGTRSGEMDGTPILDIKPYLPHVDSHVEALGSFTEKTKEYFIPVEIPDELLEKVPADHRAALKKVLEQDPRPSYQNSEERVYGLSFAGMEIKFQVKDEVLHVVGVEM